MIYVFYPIINILLILFFIFAASIALLYDFLYILIFCKLPSGNDPSFYLAFYKDFTKSDFEQIKKDLKQFFTKPLTI